MSAQELEKNGVLKPKIKIGDRVDVTYLGQSNFSLLKGGELAAAKKSELKKGDLVVARSVKYVAGKGLAVQLNLSHSYGFVPICELTDELNANIVHEFVDKAVFACRVIDFEPKTQKPILSCRESVLDQIGWKLISAEGTSAAFNKADESRQMQGNLRNKILKYGADVALARGDLAIGYVTNIGKAGCFIQIGHNCTVRAGLNELSDLSNYNFEDQLPLGTLVVGRISKITDAHSGPKRFHFSTRQSIVVYGVGTIEKSKL